MRMSSMRCTTRRIAAWFTFSFHAGRLAHRGCDATHEREQMAHAYELVIVIGLDLLGRLLCHRTSDHRCTVHDAQPTLERAHDRLFRRKTIEAPIPSPSPTNNTPSSSA